jgi:hypothetical protein
MPLKDLSLLLDTLSYLLETVSAFWWREFLHLNVWQG